MYSTSVLFHDSEVVVLLQFIGDITFFEFWEKRVSLYIIIVKCVSENIIYKH